MERADLELVILLRGPHTQSCWVCLDDEEDTESAGQTWVHAWSAHPLPTARLPSTEHQQGQSSPFVSRLGPTTPGHATITVVTAPSLPMKSVYSYGSHLRSNLRPSQVRSAVHSVKRPTPSTRSVAPLLICTSSAHSDHLTPGSEHGNCTRDPERWGQPRRTGMRRLHPHQCVLPRLATAFPLTRPVLTTSTTLPRSRIILHRYLWTHRIQLRPVVSRQARDGSPSGRSPAMVVATLGSPRCSSPREPLLPADPGVSKHEIAC